MAVVIAGTRYDEDRKYVLVAYEKHGDRFLDATTKEAFLASALKLLRERAQGGWYHELGERRPPRPPEMTQEQIAAMPDGELKKAAQDQWQQYRGALRERTNDDNWAAKITVAAEDGDGELAWEILRYKSDGEYERVELEELESGQPSTITTV